MKAITLTILVTLLTITYASAQPDSLWSTVCGGEVPDNCAAIVQTYEGNFALAGITNSFGAGGGDFWLVMISEDGDSLWSKTYGGDEFDWCSSIVQTPDSGYALAGGSWSFTEGFFDYWLVKTDVNGDSMWAKNYGGGFSDGCGDILISSENELVMAGYTESHGAGRMDFWFVKVDEDGNDILSRTYGGGDMDDCHAIIETDSGNFVLAGVTRSFGEGASDFWLVKVNDEGDEIWSQTYGEMYNDECYDFVMTPDGGFALAGNTEDDEGNIDFYLVVTDDEGEMLWSRNYGGEGEESLSSIIASPYGGYILAGQTYSFGNGGSDMWLLRVDEEGDSLWSATFGGEGSDGAQAIIEAAGGGYAVAGNTRSTGAGLFDFWLLRLDEDPMWVSPFDNSSVPDRIYLENAYPNPFNSATTISYGLPVNANVILNIFDMNGRRISSVRQGIVPAGRHTLTLNAEGWTAGPHLLQLTADNLQGTRLVILVR